jgi:hypothetical protein
MLGAGKPFMSVPFFWAKLGGLNLRYVGHAEQWDDIIYWGDINKKNFIAFYIQDNNVKAAVGNRRDKEMAVIEELFRLKAIPTPDDIKNECDLENLIKENY